jgi:hypothetical protein
MTVSMTLSMHVSAAGFSLPKPGGSFAPGSGNINLSGGLGHQAIFQHPPARIVGPIRIHIIRIAMIADDKLNRDFITHLENGIGAPDFHTRLCRQVERDQHHAENDSGAQARNKLSASFIANSI